MLKDKALLATLSHHNQLLVKMLGETTFRLRYPLSELEYQAFLSVDYEHEYHQSQEEPDKSFWDLLLKQEIIKQSELTVSGFRYIRFQFFSVDIDIIMRLGGLKGWKAFHHAVEAAIVRIEAEHSDLVYALNAFYDVDDNYVQLVAKALLSAGFNADDLTQDYILAIDGFPDVKESIGQSYHLTEHAEDATERIYRCLLDVLYRIDFVLRETTELCTHVRGHLAPIVELIHEMVVVGGRSVYPEATCDLKELKKVVADIHERAEAVTLERPVDLGPAMAVYPEPLTSRLTQ